MRFQELRVTQPLLRIKESLKDIKKACSEQNLEMLKAEVDFLSKAASKDKKAAGSFIEERSCPCFRFRAVQMDAKVAKLKDAYKKITLACNQSEIESGAAKIKEIREKKAALRKAAETKATSAIRPGPTKEALHEKMREAWRKIKKLNAAELEKSQEFMKKSSKKLKANKEEQADNLSAYFNKLGKQEGKAAEKFTTSLDANTKKWDAMLDNSAAAKDRETTSKQQSSYKVDLEAKSDERDEEKRLTESVDEAFQAALKKKDVARKEADAEEKTRRKELAAERKAWVKKHTAATEKRVEKRCAKHTNKQKRKSCVAKRTAREKLKLSRKESQRFDR